jgi:hypothetical protein
VATTRTATKPADDQPFDFNLDTLKPAADLSPFRVHFGGRRWTLKNMNELDAWELLTVASGGDVAAVAGSLRLALGDQWDAFKALGMPQWKVMPLFRAWKEHSGDVDPGESSASSGS